MVGALKRKLHKSQGLLLLVLTALGLQNHVNQRQTAMMQSIAAQLLQPREGLTGLQQLNHLVKQPCLRNILNKVGQIGNGLGGLCLKLKLQLGCKTYNTKHPHGVFPVATLGLPNNSDAARLKIFYPMVIVENRIA